MIKKKKRRKKLRVFLGLQEIAGYYMHLRSCLEEIGLSCTQVNLYENLFFRGHTDINFFIRLATSTNKKVVSTGNKRSFFFLFWFPVNTLCKILLFLWTLTKFDVFILGHKSTFMNFYDLPLLRFFRKKIIFIFHGTDSRPPYINGAFLIGKGTLRINGVPMSSLRRTYIRTILTKRMVRKVEKYAHYCINQMPQAYFHRKPFIFTFALGLPYKGNESISTPKKVKKKSATIQILHSPSRPLAKGTEKIKMVIERLKEKGFDITFTCLTGVPNEVVKEHIATCDIVLDQLYSDIPSSIFAMEGISFGKPVVMCGYYQKYVNEKIPEIYRPKIDYYHPKDLEYVLERLIRDAELRKQKGAEGKTFLENQWKKTTVANNFMRLFTDDVPEKWYWNPYEEDEIYPSFIEEDLWKGYISCYISKYGKKGLFLKDKRKIEQKIMEVASPIK